MADEISLDNPGRGRGGMVRELLSAYSFPFLLTIVLMIACYAASLQQEDITRNGQLIRRVSTPTLGVFLGGLVVVTLVTPGVVMAEEGWTRRCAAWAGVVDGVLLVWLVPVFRGVISLGDWGEAVLVLVAYGAAIAGLVTALRRGRVNAVLAAGVTVAAGLAWLAWPVWMAPWLTGAKREVVVAWLVWGHPVFALDGAMLEAFGQPWAQMAIAYRLTNVGDDIGYEMPQSVWACVGVHLFAAIILVGPTILVRRGGRGGVREFGAHDSSHEPEIPRGTSE